MNLLKIRKRIQSKRRYAVRRGNLKKLDKKWRRPFGRDSKIRMHRAGHAKHPSIGDRSPTEVRGFNQFGLKEVIIHNPAEIGKMKPGAAVVIASSVGKKKREKILSIAREKKIRVMHK